METLPIVKQPQSPSFLVRFDESEAQLMQSQQADYTEVDTSSEHQIRRQ